MVGSITYYRSVPEEEDGPMRLESHYIARMPEDNYPTFKNQFEHELEHAEEGIDGSAKKVILVDGHKSIWGYVDQNPRFDKVY